ncbi:hypothetical protein CsSME_00046179 [Camellia sinensis var. sinensis]
MLIALAAQSALSAVGRIAEIGHCQHDAIEQIGLLKAEIENEQIKVVAVSQRADYEVVQAVVERARANSETERARNFDQLRLAAEEKAKASEEAIKLAHDAITKLKADMEESKKAKERADSEISKALQAGQEAALESYAYEVPKFENWGFKHNWVKALAAANMTLAQPIPYEVDVDPRVSDPEE